MDKIYVVFWTQSGNTQAMAQAVAEGITAAGKTPELVFVSEIPADALKDEAAFALDVPQWARKCWKKAKWSRL